MPPGDERSWHSAVLAFDLCAATLADPVPKLLADLTAPGERVHDLERELPLLYFSPFEALPEDIAYDGSESVHAGATWTPGGAEEVPRSTSGALSGRHDRNEDSMDRVEDRGHLEVPATAPEVQERSPNPAYQEPPTLERPETTLPTDSMSLLGTLAEDVLEAGKTLNAPARHANAPPQATRSRRPDLGNETAAPVHPPTEHPAASEDRSVEGLPGYVDEGLDTPAAARPGVATDVRAAGPGGGGSGALIDSLAEDLFSPLAPGAAVYGQEVGDRSGEPIAPDHSTFGALDGAFDEHGGGLPAGVGLPDERIPEKVPGQYHDAEAFADLVNDVLVRQARRHGVDLS